MHNLFFCFKINQISSNYLIKGHQMCLIPDKKEEVKILHTKVWKNLTILIKIIYK